MECKKCRHKLFRIQVIPCCDDCDQNGAWDSDDDEYTYDLEIIEEKKLIRDYVQEEGECLMDTAWGSGCYMFICEKCNHRTNLAVTDGC